MRLAELFEAIDDRLERARALGFDLDEPVYHGTKAGEFPAFKINYRKAEQLGFGIHVTPDQSFAERYAHDPDLARDRKGKQPHVFVGFLRKGRVLDARAIVREGSPEFALALKLAGRKAYTPKDENGIRCIYMQNAIDSTSGARAEALIRAAGYDTIAYEAHIKEPASMNHFVSIAKAPSYVVLNPACLRRSDAAFDPAMRDSDDLLA